jgi:hypothetical protein
MNILPSTTNTNTNLCWPPIIVSYLFLHEKERERERARESERDILGECRLHIDMFFCMNMRFKVLCIAACSRQLSQLSITMARKGRQWVVRFRVKDVVHHFKTGRQGVVTRWDRGYTHMWILFDDGYKEKRRKSAYNKGVSWLKTWRK